MFEQIECLSEINNNKTVVRLKILSHSFNYRDSAKTATVYVCTYLTYDCDCDYTNKELQNRIILLFKESIIIFIEIT